MIKYLSIYLFINIIIMINYHCTESNIETLKTELAAKNDYISIIE